MLSCKGPKRAEINASIWLNNAPLPTHLCAKHRELQHYGFYRKLNTGAIEFISFCDAGANQWLAMHQKDFDSLLDKYVPNSKED